MDPLARLQDLLRTLFQLDTADLDFGIYRLYHLKREEMESFIGEQIPQSVQRAFGQVAEEQTAALREEKETLTKQIRDEVGDEAFTADGTLRDDVRALPVRSIREAASRYDAVRTELQQVEATEAQQIEVFNHLYAFFSRYYEDGDFIPKRRYGMHETYAVPYDGQEVYLHWANKGQHYVKTGERLRDYAFTVEALGGPYRVRFQLVEATVARENTKGETRFFFPRPDSITYADKTLVVPFEYRLPTEEELQRYGKNARGQAAILEEALDPILEAVPEDALALALKGIVRETEKEQVSLLLRRLRHFTQKQTSDFFVHKDLKGFLTRELEFYIKDQVLHLGDLRGDLPAKLRIIQVFRQVAEDIITFLDQLERVQCRLFEKKKFVLRTDYLCPIQHVPRELWGEVLENDAQRAEWRDLYGIEDTLDETFLATHPTLVVHTAHFPEAFTLRLLAAFDDIEEATDGLLVHGENYQALNLLQARYRNAIDCVYIDPLYNTGQDGFQYKDRYQHSTWMSMMDERVALSRQLLTGRGLFISHIDEHEFENLQKLLTSLYGDENHLEPIVWDKRNPKGDATGIAAQHESVCIAVRDFSALKATGGLKKTKENAQAILRKAQELVRRKGGVTDEARSEFAEWLKKMPFSGGEKAYSKLDEQGRVFRSVSMAWPNKKKAPDEYFTPLLHPVTGKPCPVPARGWRNPPPTMRELEQQGLIIFGPDETTQPTRKYLLRDYLEENVPSVLSYGGSDDDLHAHMGFSFENPKPLYVAQYLIGVGAPEGDDSVLDCFAGSGTTGHAVINLNRESGCQRRFILVEMDVFFDTVLLPRIQKVMYCPDWRDGKPVNYPEPSLDGMWPDWVERTPRLVKVLRLEGYEDSLSNLSAEDTLSAEAPRAEGFRQVLGEDQYRLHYLARLPLEASDSLLDVARLAHPFSYRLQVLSDEGPRQSPVDLVETFNLLYGLRVQRIEAWRNDADGRAYRAVRATKRDGQRVLVLWRDMEGLDPAVERTFLEGRIQGYDEVLINGDAAVPGVQSLDPLFKRLMEAGEA
jgi:adenine-specific DNA-methyltransferase